MLKLVQPLKEDTYNIYLQLFDNQGKGQAAVLRATVCECEGPVERCPERRAAAFGAPAILAILGAILALLSECARGCPPVGES